MSNNNGVSLDSLRQEARRRYADYPVQIDESTTVVLRAPLRLRSDERTALREMQQAISSMQDDPTYSDTDLLELLRDIVRTVADDSELGQRLVDAIGDDLAVLQTMFEYYSERTQSGEASHSAN